MFALAALVAWPQLSRAQSAPFEALRTLDARLAAVAGRLLEANAMLCPAQAPGTGLVIHALDQYPPRARAGARAQFGFPTLVSIEAVVAASAGAAAGAKAGDGIVAINQVRLPNSALAPQATSGRRDAVLAMIADLPPSAPLLLEVERDGERSMLVLHPRPVCRTQFELDPAESRAARSDGRVIQLGAGWFERYGDDNAAVIFAHELAHTVLRHRAVLGDHPSRTAVRVAEDAADLLSLTLLRAAGYDPALAPRFWRAHGPELARWRLHDGTHARSAARAAAMEAELARTANPVGARAD